jgi:hypothetical protein
MAILAALVIAFAQPFLADKSTLREKETVVYLDDSFSMQARLEGATLLENAVQSLIKSLPENQNFTLFTNNKVFKDVVLSEVRNELLAIEPTADQLQLNEIDLKGNTFFKGDAEAVKNLVIVSDFQERMASDGIDTTGTTLKQLVKMTPETVSNVSLDSIYLDGQNSYGDSFTSRFNREHPRFPFQRQTAYRQNFGGISGKQ